MFAPARFGGRSSRAAALAIGRGAMLRTRPPRSSFFAGSRRLQSDVVALARPEVTEKQCAFLASELGQEAPPSPDLAARFLEVVIGAHAALLREAGFFFPESAELVEGDQLA